MVDKLRPMLKVNLIFPAVLWVLVLLAFITSFGFPTRPRALPLLVSALTLAFLTIQLTAEAQKIRMRMDKKVIQERRSSSQGVKLLVTFLATYGYLLLWNVIGTLAATILYVFGLVSYYDGLSRRRVWRNLVIGVVGGGLLYALFKILEVPLP